MKVLVQSFATVSAVPVPAKPEKQFLISRLLKKAFHA